MSGDRARIPAWLLPVLMLAGALAGALVGGFGGARWSQPSFEPVVLLVRAPGTIFLGLLKALAIPLVLVSVTLGVAGMGDVRKFGRMMGRTAIYFLGTTFLAVVTGILLVDLIRPGGPGIDPSTTLPTFDMARTSVSAGQAIYDVIVGMFPPNLFEAAAKGNILGLIVYSLVFGGILGAMGERARPLLDVLQVVNDALMSFIRIVIWAAPVGIFGLVADRFGQAGGGDVVIGEVGRLGWYAATVLLGLLFHAGVSLLLILSLFARRDGARYLANMGDALVTAFGTASSAATMPVTLRCVVEKNRVSRSAAELVIPVGTTVNMDGTALYEAVAVIFIAQASGIELSLGQHIIVAVTATLAAIGAAAIPEAGLVTMVLVLGAVGLPPEGVGLLLSIDWILDRARTAVNVWGDSVGAAVVDRLSGTARNEAT